MSKDSLIAKQALKIDFIESLVDKQNIKLDEIHNLFICVSGPLNDNKLEYTRDQQSIFRKIVSIIER